MKWRLALLLSAAIAPCTQAQDMLIRNATVHTTTAQGTLHGTDILVRNGRIAAVGKGLSSGGATVVDAQQRPVTPALFAGITDIGVEEVSGESATVDSHLALNEGKSQQARPEFDVTLAYNPDSVLVPVARIEGLGWTLLAAEAGGGGSFVGGQGGVQRLDGSLQPIGPKALFITLGSDGARLTGGSRAAQWMLLDQLVEEARGRIAPDAPHALLTPAGRRVLQRFLQGEGRIVFTVQRAADIVRLLDWSGRHGVRIAISGGAEAWKVASRLAAADVPVFVDPLANLPADFDQIGARADNAARLQAAGVAVGFVQGPGSDRSQNARKIRQLAGNAVAAGMAWDDALAGLTRVPAQAFGVGGEVGGIAPGRRADLVLWSGDPLDVAHAALQVWMDGRSMPMRSRQTELRDRYLRHASDMPHAYPASGH